MKIAFKDIKGLLEDSFFEIRYLGKEAIKQRILPINRYSQTPDNFHFINWIENDNQAVIEYSFLSTEIGKLLIANTSKGICFLGFACNGDEELREDFMRRFPNNRFKEQTNDFQRLAVEFCNGDNSLTMPLHLKGTAFQVAIWKQLVRIPEGRLSTYGSLSDEPGAAKAIGSAVGANPVSYIIPCHRIVKRDGNIQGYHWGGEIKRQLLCYELQQ